MSFTGSKKKPPSRSQQGDQPGTPLETTARSSRDGTSPGTNDKRYTQDVDDLQQVLTGIPDRPTKNLMTFEELQAKIGSAPKKNRLFGAYKMSERYKAIGEKLATVKATLANATLGQITAEGGRETFETALNRQLDEIVAAGQRYQKKHTGKKGRAVQGLLDDVARFRREIPSTLDALTDEDDALPDDLPLDQAMAAKTAGITPANLKGISPQHCDFAKFNDGTREGPSKELGKGSVNTVQLVKHGGVERVFKEEQQTDTSKAWAPQFMGINVKDDPRYGNRNVAGGVVGKLLGAKVMPESRFAVNDGKVGLLMEKAPGKTLAQLLKDKSLDEDSFSPKALASLQQQLMDMEACDILTGQSDRHPGNYMIDIKGDEVTVTAIDNDFAFPNTDNVIFGDKTRIPLKFPGMNSIENLPALMSKTVADKIKAIDFDNDVAPSLQSLLEPAELRDAKTRFQALRNHVTGLERDGCIVTDWEKWRSPLPQAMTATVFLAAGGKDKTSLFSRDFGKVLDL